MSENPYGQNPPQQPPQPPQNPYGTGAGENPYGQQPPVDPQQPPAQEPFPQSPPAQNPYGQNPYGQNPYGQAPYEQNPYGQAPTGGPLGDGLDMYGRPLGRRVSDERPGTVTAAGWIAMVLSGLSFLLYGFITIAMIVAKDDVTSEIDKAIRDSGSSSSSFSAEDAYGVVLGVLLVLTLWCLIAAVLGFFVLRRSRVARILLIISSAVTAAFSLLGIQSVVSAVPLLGSIAVIVLLFVGGASAWFRDRY